MSEEILAQIAGAVLDLRLSLIRAGGSPSFQVSVDQLTETALRSLAGGPRGHSGTIQFGGITFATERGSGQTRMLFIDPHRLFELDAARQGVIIETDGTCIIGLRAGGIGEVDGKG